MRLVACAEPEGPLEEAPECELLVGALLPDERMGDGARCAGYWARDDRYYARVVRQDGGVRWLTFDRADATASRSADRRLSIGPALPLRHVALVGRASARGRSVRVLSARPRRRG